MLLADIGNTHIHIYQEDKSVIHLKYLDAIKEYGSRDIYYINVNRGLDNIIQRDTNWVDISYLIKLNGEYRGMGVDRKALCLSHRSGLFIDAGSAITVDIMEDGVYQGGFILSGIKSLLESYKNISPLLDIDINYKISLDRVPLTTKDGISYGIIAPIKTIIERHQEGRNLYFTGGDGEYLSSLFKDSLFDDKLVFKGMLTQL